MVTNRLVIRRQTMIHLETILYKTFSENFTSMGCCQSGQRIHPMSSQILVENDSICSDDIKNVIEQVTMEAQNETSIKGEPVCIQASLNFRGELI